MYKRILVPVDGSKVAEAALEHAVVLAKQFKAEVTLLRVTSVAMLTRQALGAADDGQALITDIEPIVEQERKEARDYLRKVASKLSRRGVKAPAEQAEGAAAPTILEAARKLPADVIVMSTHGRSGLARAVFGSVAEEVVRHAPCPVLLVRAKE